MEFPRWTRTFFLGSAALAAWGCGTRPPPPMMDVVVTDITTNPEGGCTGTRCDGGRDVVGADNVQQGEAGSDGGSSLDGGDDVVSPADGSSTDDGGSSGDGTAGNDGSTALDGGTTDDGSSGFDGSTGNDGSVADVVMIPQGPCAPLAPANKLTNEMRELPRPVYVTASGSTFAAGTRSQALGLDETFVTLIDTTGSSVARTNVSQGGGAAVEGGAVAPNADGFVVAFSSNAAGPVDVFLRPVGADGSPAGPSVRVSNDVDPSTQAQVVQTPTGWTVVWRTQTGTTALPSLLGAAVSAAGYVVGPTVSVTPVGDVPGPFVLTADGGTVVVAYLSQDPLGGNTYRALVLGANAAPTGSPFSLSPAGAMVSDALAAAVHGTELFAAWSAQPLGEMNLVRMDLTNGSLLQQRTATELGQGLSKPGAARDPAGGWALAYRDGIGGGAVRFVRVAADLSTGGQPSLVGTATSGDVVRVFAGAGQRYLVGWDDVGGGVTTAFAELLQCP